MSHIEITSFFNDSHIDFIIMEKIFSKNLSSVYSALIRRDDSHLFSIFIIF